MANVVPYAFKQGILKGQHDLSALNGYYLALYTTAAPYTVNDSVYSSAVANQVGTVGTAYTTNGLTAGQGVVAQTGDYTTVDFTTDPTWTASTITVEPCGLLYRSISIKLYILLPLLLLSRYLQGSSPKYHYYQ